MIEQYIIDNYQKLTSLQISKNLSIPTHKIRYIIKKLKLSKIKNDKNMEIKNLLNLGLTVKEICEKLNISISTGHRIIRKYNLTIKNRHPLYNINCINHSYFSAQNLKLYPERFVIIGFIASDGCIYERKNSKTLIFNISKKDKVALDIINRELSNSQRIIRNQEKTNSLYLDFPSNEISNDLSLYNIIPQKTQNMDFPKIITEQCRYYLRGVFYGDGNIYLNNNKKRYSIICNNIFGNSLKLYSDLNISYCCMSKLKNNPGYCQLVWQGKHAIGFENFIFNDDKMILLKRKHI